MFLLSILQIINPIGRSQWPKMFFGFILVAAVRRWWCILHVRTAGWRLLHVALSPLLYSSRVVQYGGLLSPSSVPLRR